MKYFSMFTGIGGFELGMSEKHECVGMSEIDPYCCKLLEERFKGVKNYGDATKIRPEELPEFDLLCAGFPCQAFTIAGTRQGFKDPRGTMFYELVRILESKRPLYFLFENVKGILSHENGKTFSTMLAEIQRLGYDCEWMVLNSKDFELPQSRQRVFIIGHSGAVPRQKVIFDRETSKNRERKIVEVNHGFHRYRTYSPLGLSPTLTSYHEAGYATTKVEFEDNRIRFLSPKEYERLQGFPDDWTVMLPEIERYKKCGNAVSVNVVRDLREVLFG